MENDDSARYHFTIGNADDVISAVARIVGDCVMLIDLDGRVLTWNTACEDMFGWPQHEVVGERLPFVPADDRLRTVSTLRALAASCKVGELDMRVMRPDGALMPMRYAIIPVFDADTNPSAVFAVSADVPDGGSALHSKPGVGVLTELLIKGPLSIISGHAGLLGRSGAGRDERARAKSVAAIARAADEARRIAEDLGILARLGARTDGSVTADVAATLTDVAASLPQGFVLLDFEAGPVTLRADEATLHMVFRGCLAEARRLARPDAPVSVSLNDAADEMHIQLVVLVDKNAQKDAGGHPRGSREGAALVVVREVVASMGGSISMQSIGRDRIRFDLRFPKE